MIDYVRYCPEPDSRDVAARAAVEWVIPYFRDTADKTWFDDFGWWTIATARAAGLLSGHLLTDQQTKLKNIISESWSQFTGTAPFVWDRCTKNDQNQFDRCGPFIFGGVWNGYWTGTVLAETEKKGPADGDPHAKTLLGKQNTVTNAVYLLSAQAVEDDDRANMEFAFLDKWFRMRSVPLWVPLWWQVDDKAALVRERVSIYNDRGTTSVRAPGFDEQWAWTGDQGLIIGALVGKATQDASADVRKTLVNRAVQLLEGVKLKLVDKNKILNNWTLTGTVPSDNDYRADANYDDYSTGSGVFWRYVLRVWDIANQKDTPEEFSALKEALSAEDFTTILRTNAEAATLEEGKRPNWPNSYQPREQYWVTLTNDLAVLVAASRMLKAT